MDHNTFEIEPRQIFYRVVKFYKAEENAHSGLHCVPSSWIKWEDEKSATVLVVYPDEPRNITRERVKNFESPNDNWNWFFAEIMYSTDSYYDAIRYIDECENAEKYVAENVSMEIQSHQCSIPLNSSLSSEIGESAFLLEFDEEINRQLKSDPQSLIVNTIDEIIHSKSEISKFEMDQEDIYEFKEDVHLDLPLMSLKTNRNVTTSQALGQDGNNLYGAACNSSDTDEKWTLKHREYSPGLVELMPNTGVYIRQADLMNCLRSSKTCTGLTRRLTANIFTESALRKCTYFGPQSGDISNRLNVNAVREIANFVQKLEYKRNSRVPNIVTIYSAIWYQMEKCKENNYYKYCRM